MPVPAPPHNARLIIDYVATALEARGMGLASLLVSFVTRAAASLSPPANLYVVATEDSCVYWMGRGYVLEVSERLNARLNVFNDTHLLRQAGDPEDAGDEADLPRRRDQPWAQLSAAERRHASRLGFTPESWDADEWGGVPLTWAESQRDAAAREAAEALQFDEASWHGGGGGGGGADAQDDDELQAAIALSLGQWGGGS